MESLLNEQELNVDLPQPGEIRTGMIASISPSQILVSIGAKSEGVVSGRELDALTPEERDALKVGQEVQVKVLGVDPELGVTQTAHARCAMMRLCSKLRASSSSRQTLSLRACISCRPIQSRRSR